MKKITLLLFILLLRFAVFCQTTVYPSGLKVGDKAPLFEMVDNSGKLFNLSKQFEKGAVVVIFYRGQWCPYCNKALTQLNDSLALITASGASVIAISPEVQSNVVKTVAKTNASFPILSDSAQKIMKLYKVNFEVNKETQEKYRQYGIDFSEANGTNGANLPVPATYIVDKNGNISYVFFNQDYKLRPSVKELLDHL